MSTILALQMRISVFSTVIISIIFSHRFISSYWVHHVLAILSTCAATYPRLTILLIWISRAYGDNLGDYRAGLLKPELLAL